MGADTLRLVSDDVSPAGPSCPDSRSCESLGGKWDPLRAVWQRHR
jgi:hypothetical protein